MLGAKTCTHVWQIDPPNGPTSEGMCRLCGETRRFNNYLPGTGDRVFQDGLYANHPNEPLIPYKEFR